MATCEWFTLGIRSNLVATTVTQDDDFIAHVIPSTILKEAIGWIASNMNPDDVFSEEDLKMWAEYNDFVARSDLP